MYKIIPDERITMFSNSVLQVSLLFIAVFILVCLCLLPYSGYCASEPQGNTTLSPSEQQLDQLENQLKLTKTSFIEEVINPLIISLKNGEIVYLIGIDIPDIYDAAEYGESGPIALMALEKLREILSKEKVQLYQTRDSDSGRENRMGHITGHLYLPEQDLWVQGFLLENGLARVKTTPRNPELATLMYQLEKQARNDKKGLWDNYKYQIMSTRDLNNIERLKEAFTVVEGKIISVATHNNRIYLNFGDNWRNDFTAGIDATDRRLFSKTGLDPLSWQDKTIRIRGWMENWNGPYIQVTHPEQIELMDNSDNDI